MKKIKSLLFILPLFFINLVQAYGESYGKFIGGVYVDTQLVSAAVIFLLFFAAFLFITRKTNLFRNDTVRIVISIIFSIFSIFGIQKLGINYSEIFFDLGLQDFLMKYFPLILGIALLITMFVWNIGVVLMVLGTVIIIAGILGGFNQDIIYRWELTTMIGGIIFIIGLGINKRILNRFGNALRNSDFMTKNIFKSKRRIKRTIKKLKKTYKRCYQRGEIEKANKVLEQITYFENLLKQLEGEIKETQKVEKRIRKNRNQSTPAGGSPIYKPGMRRGGDTKRRSRFVSKALVERYAKIYGESAAKKRFGKYKV